MNDDVLHVGKVSGISGSEAHLLTLLPDLRERGWDVRFVHLHENESGAPEFARRLTAAGVPVEGFGCRGPLTRLPLPACCASCGARVRRSCTRTSCTPTSTA